MHQTDRLIRNLEKRYRRFKRIANPARLLTRLLSEVTRAALIPIGASQVEGLNFSRPELGIRPILFIGYGGPIGLLPHLLVAHHLKKYGIRSEVRRPKNLIQAYSRDWTRSRTEATMLFDSARALTKALVKGFPDQYFLSRGIIDEFFRRAPHRMFLGSKWFPDAYPRMVANVVVEAEKLLESYSGLVVVDSAYLVKGALTAAAKKQGKPVWNLDLDGRWKLVREGPRLRGTKGFAAEAQKAIRDDSAVLRRAQDYVHARFEGANRKDIDSFFAYSGFRGDSSPSPRKVLFLHAIRDAGGLPLGGTDGDLSFESFLEWTEFTLEKVAQQPDYWWVKPHPQRLLFPDEKMLADILLDRYGIPLEIVKSDLDTRWVLRNGWPIYTHSGTVALEAAAMGQRPFVASSTFSPAIANVPTSKSDLEKQLLLRPEEAMHNLSDKERQLAVVSLYRRFQFDAAEIGVTFVRGPRKTKDWNSPEAELAQARELFMNYQKQNTHQKADQLAKEINVEVKKMLFGIAKP